MSDGTDWCRHYHGIGKVCEAGVDPQSVYVELTKRGERTHYYPCFEEDGVAHACSHCSYLTPEERQAQRKESAAVWKKFVDDLNANRCPFCNAVIEQRKQVGRCVYAHPCGHRLYQGKA
jgi:hypothetical protein